MIGNSRGGVAWRGVGSAPGSSNPRSVAIRAALEWRGVGIVANLELPGIVVGCDGVGWRGAQFQINSNGVGWRDGSGVGPPRRGVGHATPERHAALARIGIAILRYAGWQSQSGTIPAALICVIFQ